MAVYDDREHFIPLRKSELIEVLESELHTDLDRDHRIGKVTRRGLPKTVRINPTVQKVRVKEKPEPLPPAYP